jgi:hypothetical protein
VLEHSMNFQKIDQHCDRGSNLLTAQEPTGKDQLPGRESAVTILCPQIITIIPNGQQDLAINWS